VSDRSGPRSIAFDRAAEYYDATRIVSEDATRLQTELLASELAGRGRVLEIGVGTGQVALPLYDAAIPIIGLDLSAPMLRRLVDKTGGAPPIGLVQSDATRMPFRRDAFGGVVMRWVLHLIPAWRDVVREVVRVLRPGGVVLVNHGGFSGIGVDIRERVEELVGRPLSAAGLDWEAWSALAEEFGRLGASHRELSRYVEHSDEPLGVMVEGVEAGRYSWLWGLDEEERRAAARELGAWVEERYGPLDVAHSHDTTITWHAYDLRAAGSRTDGIGVPAS
jgi:ubiquinone/menaquinone biosynthesis C-methylase UbiE